MEFEDISNEELEKRILLLRGKEREVTLKLLIHLAEFDSRKGYLSLGYSSLFDYCVRKLKYSDGSAYRRVQSARYLVLHQELKESFLKGEVTLCTLAEASKCREQNPLEIIGKSKREIQVLASKEKPTIKPKEKIKAITVKPKAVEIGDLFTKVPGIIESQKEAKEERYELKFSVSKEFYDELNAVKAKLSNSLGADLSLENVFKKLMTKYLAKPRKIKARATNENSRYIPKAIRREIFKLDCEQCSYVSPEGVRCTERHNLQCDHIKPFGVGGRTNKNNLRVLCSAHNKFLAEQTFGKFAA